MVSGEEDTADVIGIHGLNGHGFNTWVDTRDDVMWLREYLGLQHELSGVRIMSFGYDTSGCAPTPTGGNMQMIEDVAKGLCECIEGMRIDNPLRPIVFVAYGLGGVVVKQALRLSRRQERFRDIHDATKGMIFLGYPSDHSGVTYYVGAIALNSLALGVVGGQPSREDTFESVGFYEISGDAGKTYVIEDGQRRTEDRTRHDYKVVSTYVMRMIRDAREDAGAAKVYAQSTTPQGEPRHGSTPPAHNDSNGPGVNQSSAIQRDHRLRESTKNAVMDQSKSNLSASTEPLESQPHPPNPYPANSPYPHITSTPNVRSISTFPPSFPHQSGSAPKPSSNDSSSEQWQQCQCGRRDCQGGCGTNFPCGRLYHGEGFQGFHGGGGGVKVCEKR
ncbi:hypothetical protein K440DRAFT_609688 [Wilcoxina mikolae CBS 423.85]|nr:hypothetical protein K440DRAFT_609688 [Wilcoxina mikolae CBS 423.85]